VQTVIEASSGLGRPEAGSARRVSYYVGSRSLVNRNRRRRRINDDACVCADHNIAWRTRNTLALDYVPGGVSGDPTRPDNIVYDITPQAGQMPGVSASGWGHASCSPAATDIAGTLPTVKP
jgi:hypothetical protein